MTFVVNRNINVSNVHRRPRLGSASAAARRTPTSTTATSSPAAHDAVAFGATEICMQSGIHPDQWLESLPGWLWLAKETAPQLHLHAYSLMEIAHMCDTDRLPPAEVLARLAEAGLDPVPGMRRRGARRRRAAADQPQQAAGRALGGDHRGGGSACALR